MKQSESRVLSAARNVKADLDTDHDLDWDDVRILAEWVLSELNGQPKEPVSDRQGENDEREG